MFQRALQGYETALGANNAMTYVPALNTTWNIAFLFERQSDLAKARDMYSKALVGCEKVFGPDHSKCQSLQEIIIALDTVKGE